MRNNKRHYGFFIFVLLLGTAFLPLLAQETNPYAETLTQVSTINSLMAGHFDGMVSFGELKPYGDFGIGTFHSLDGEMIELEGKVYQARVDGHVYQATDALKTPFAAITWFEPDEEWEISGTGSLEAIQKQLNMKIEKDFFYAIRIRGDFDYVKTRSVTSQKPYPPLTEEVKRQKVFEKSDVRGTLVGIYCPEFMNGLNVPGYHFHFLSDDHAFGGHVLEAQVKKATVIVDKTTGFHMILPADFSAGASKKGDIAAVEKDTSVLKKKSLTLVFDKDWPPFCFVEKEEGTGFLIDLAQAVGEASGVAIVPQPLQWKEAQEQVLSGKADLITGLGKSEERMKQYEFAENPATGIALKLFVPSDQKIASVQYFKGKVATENGSLYSKILSQKHPEIAQTFYPTERESLIALSRGEAQGCMGADLAMYYYMRKEGLKNIKAVGTPIELINIYFAAQKGNREVMALWNRGFATIRGNGTYDNLYRKWFIRELTEEEMTKMVQAAEEARTFAYAPYSNFTVGAAVLTNSGKIYTGCNVENALYGLTSTATKVALNKAVSEGDTEIRAIVNVLNDGSIGAPASDDRQIIYEFGRGILIVFREDSHYTTRTIADLIPYPFDMNK